jgi:hypothetical protein
MLPGTDRSLFRIENEDPLLVLESSREEHTPLGFPSPTENKKLIESQAKRRKAIHTLLCNKGKQTAGERFVQTVLLMKII